MPGSAPAPPLPCSPPTPAQIRSFQLAALGRVAARYGFPPIPNEFPHQPEPEPAAVVLRRQLAHLRLAGTVLDERHRPRPRLNELLTLDGVPLVVETVDRYAPLERCILCGGTKGETYTICAGCYTTQARFAERMLLEILPDLDESSLVGIKPLSHEQFVRAIRRTPRLEPKRRGRLEPRAEAARRTARRAVAAAERATRLEMLRAMAEEPGLPTRDRQRRLAHLRALEAAEPWNPAAWLRALAANPLEDAWLALLASGPAAEEAREADDDYPVEWQDEEWLAAPDRVDFLEETAPPLIPRPNTAAGGPEHLAALERNALFDAYVAARTRAMEQDGPDPYLDWLASELEARGGIPARTRARGPQEWDADECERWDRWIDGILGGDPVSAPDALDPFDAARCAHWGAAITRGKDGERTPVQLSRLGTGLPSGRMRWPRFIREEIEAEFQPWGRWIELPDDEGGAFRVWTDEDLPRRRRRLTRAAAEQILKRRLETWAREGTHPKRVAPPRSLDEARPRGSVADWEREIRADHRRRRFEQGARANAGIHATRLEHARSQSI